MSKLSEILEDQLAEAKAKAGTIIIRKLYKGLRIEMTAISNEIRLTLTRDDQYPSMQEWDTVTKHFPYVVPKIMPNTEQKGSRFTISARFPNARTIQQIKFF